MAAAAAAAAAAVAWCSLRAEQYWGTLLDVPSREIAAIPLARRRGERHPCATHLLRAGTHARLQRRDGHHCNRIVSRKFAI